MNLKLISELKFLSKYVKENKKSFVMFFWGWHLEAVINLMLPLLFGRLIDEMVYYKNLLNFFKLVLVIFVLSVFLCTLYFAIYTFYNQNYGKYAVKIKMDIMDHILNTDIQTINDVKNGDLITMINSYADECVTIINRNVIYTFYCCFVIAFYVLYIYAVDLKLGVIVTLFVAISIFVSLKTTHHINKFSDKEKLLYGRYTGWLLEMINSVVDLRLLQAEKKIQRDFSEHIKHVLHAGYKKNKFSLHLSNIAEGTTLCFQLLMFFIGALYIKNDAITLGMFVTIMTYYGEVRQNVLYLNEYFIDLQDRVSYVKYIRNFLQKPSEKDDLKKKDIVIARGEIDLCNVCFSYDSNIILNGLSLTIHPGEHIALVGNSGCGKTTLINMLIGYLSPLTGEIYIDGVNIEDIARKSLRRQIGVVHQEAYIFNGTIRQNLMMGNLHASEEELLQAC